MEWGWKCKWLCLYLLYTRKEKDVGRGSGCRELDLEFKIMRIHMLSCNIKFKGVGVWSKCVKGEKVQKWGRRRLN